MTKDKKNRPMYFASLEVENVKSFGTKQILDLRDSNGVLSPWTLILGDNGIGKTTLLKCLAWMMPVEFAEPARFELARKLKAKIENVQWIKEITETSDTKWEIMSEKLKAKVEEDIQWIKKVTKISNKEWEMLSNENQNEKDIKRMTPLMDSVNENEINAIIRVGKGVKMKIETSFTIGVALGKVPDKENLMTLGISLARKENEAVNEIQDILNTDHLTTAQVEEFNTPNLFAYSAARHMVPENIETLEKDPTYNLFSTSGDLYDAEEVLLELYNNSAAEEIVLLKKENEQLKNDPIPLSINEVEKKKEDKKTEGKATRYLQKVKDILAKLLPHIDNADCIIINPSNKKNGQPNTKVVEVVMPFGKVGLYDLSLGYQTMLAWVVDLAIRMFWQNPDSENPLDEPAVVIVDEIDLHLHPKWQRSLKEYLTDNFKGTQFICTAHSPFLAQASADENLCVLHEFKITPAISEAHIENDPYIVRGWRIGQVVTNLIGVDERGPVIENLEKERRILIDKLEPLTPDEEAELKKLSNKLETLLPISEDDDEQKLLEQIRRTAEYLKQEGKLL